MHHLFVRMDDEFFADRIILGAGYHRRMLDILDGRGIFPLKGVI